jgi:multicomponent Na+:H+ antiporter subunit E
MFPIKKIFPLAGFVLFFLKKLVHANLVIARDLLTPGLLIHPDYIKIKLEVRTDFQILLLTNLISMTPGSLVVDVAEDKAEIIVHSMYASDQRKVTEEVNEFQKRIRNIFD